VDVGVVGAGRVGTALAVLLGRAGHRIVAVSGGERARERAKRFLPGVPHRAPTEVAAASEVVVVAVPDDVISAVCGDLAAARAFGKGRSVLHLSGSVPLSALESAEAAGGTVLSIHPLQTLPTVEDALQRLPGSGMAVTARAEEGYRLGERVAEDAGGRPFRLPDERKPLYHAAAVFCSNFVTVLIGAADGAFQRAGLNEPADLFAPLARASLDHALRLGAGAALTGPVVRGDAGTVRRNLEALASDLPSAVPLYVVLAEAAMELAREAGRLEDAAGARIGEELARWR
jgi:predicted short-subunit dehydrogenase-like oxidoreductase (DUF2520 family)